ncbi:hypothetical protein EXS65_01685 [Candidatus Peribacteria bacterium]|nr:hypothetical protein [Candidatus Peribacteria bacterium]
MASRTPSKVRLTLTVFLCTLLQATPVSADLWVIFPLRQEVMELSQWVPEAGDSLLVDRDSNIGYLLHANGGFTSFPVATGQRRIVRYIGRTYNATTPLASWKAMSSEKKGDRITFGKSGRFLRLSMEDDTTFERTPYGIHSHAYIQTMLREDDRYRSMGCILVSEDVLDVIVETFEVNNDTLNVKTAAGLGNESISYKFLREKMGML